MLSKEDFENASDVSLREHRKQSFKKYILNNWIAIVALILSIISIILQVCS